MGCGRRRVGGGVTLSNADARRCRRTGGAAGLAGATDPPPAAGTPQSHRCSAVCPTPHAANHPLAYIPPPPPTGARALAWQTAHPPPPVLRSPAEAAAQAVRVPRGEYQSRGGSRGGRGAAGEG